ncbi:restriction endonuclease subunit S [Zunongwangia sp. F363]|uniref:Restriction endonuclease subunit S n=1 Tax=Autumnicola tepida TaxID=3075595 RepID=A0ABU3CBL0_9FLAO|nr:restriction endonuclease subunit S [Zunongwangia sp. F363]MDT0643727.1 restriction endonuclease subunit S [Zunongwangia sp. F363]
MEVELKNIEVKSSEEFPKDWEISEVREFAKVQTGSKDTQEKIEGGKYPFFVRSNTIESINTYSYDGEAILTAGDGVGVGKVYHYINGKFDFHQRVYSIYGFSEKALGIYFYHFFSQHFYKRVYRLSAKNSVDSVRMEMISKMKIPLPPISEQKKISAILSTWDQSIEKTQQLIEQLELRKKGLMQELLTGKKRLPGFDGEWKELKAGKLFENNSNKNHNGEFEVLSATQDKGVIPRSEVGIDIKYDKSSLKSYKKVDAGDFVISLRSFQGGIEYSSYTGLVSPAYTVLKEKLPIAKKFYLEYLKSGNFINRLNSIIYGIRDGKQISYKEFSSLKLWYPPFEEQKAIASVFTEADKEFNLQIEHLKSLKAQKKGLMQQLLTGKKRVSH